MFLLATSMACGGGEGNTGVGGLLVVSQIQVDAGNGIVLIGGSRRFQATPRTSTGIVVPGKVIAWSSTNPNVATVDETGLVLGTGLGPVGIVASVDGVSGRADIEVRPVPVATVEVTAPVTTTMAGGTLQVQAITKDSVGGVLTGRTVAWSSSNEQVATVSPAGVVTGVTAGPATITGTAEGKSGAVAILITPRPASRLGFLVQPSNAVAGAVIAPPLQVAFQDASGVTATEATGTVTLSFSANPTGATLGGTLSAAAVNGVATFSDITVNRSGQPYSLQAAAPGVTGATSATFTVAPGAATALAIVTAPAGSAASGAVLAVQPVIALRDALGNAVSQAGIAVTASVASGPGVLDGTQTVQTGAGGVATFTNLAIVGAVGTYTLRFEAPGLTPVVSPPIGLGAGGASQLTFTAAPPLEMTNAVALGDPVRIQLRDGTGNPVAQAGTLVTATLEGGTGVLGGATTAVTGAGGEASFEGLTITGVVGTFSMRFSASGLTPAVSNPITLRPGVARAITFTTAPPGTAVNGALLSVAPVVQLRDISGNAVAEAGVAILVNLQTTVTGTLQGTAARQTDADGRAVFGDLRLLGQVGNYQLSFRSGLLSEAVSNPIALTAGPATGLGFGTFPAIGTQSGVPLAPQPAIQVVDQSGNPVAAGGVTVTAALATGAGTLTGTLTAVTTGGGLATFTNLTLNGPSGPHTLRFSAPGLTDLISGVIAVGAGSPTQVTFTTAPPPSATNGVALAPPVVVQLRDNVGNPSPIAGQTVTASLQSGTGVLSGSVDVVTAADGSATFDDLVITGLIGDFVLEFSVPGLTPAVSNPIGLVAGDATQLTFTTAPPAAATNGVDLSPATVIQLRDLSGNLVESAGVTITAALQSGPVGVLSGGTAVATGATGSASFSTLRITGAVGDYVLEFTADGVSAAVSNAIALAPGAATALAMETQPPASAVSGVALSPQPAVRLVDQSGNTVATNGTTVTAELASGPGTLGGTLTAVTTSGVATFATLAITGTAGSYSIRFTAPGLTQVISGTIGLGAGAATALQFVGTPPTTATNTQALTPAIVVRLIDGSLNPVAQAGVVVTAVKGSGLATLGGTVAVATDADGVATFDNLVLTGTTGNNTIRFDASGLSSVTTATIALAAGPATQVVITTQPAGTATNGGVLSTSPVVRLRDASGNNVSQSGRAVTVTLVNASGTGTLSGTQTINTNASGQATFSTLVITGTVGTKRLQFSADTLAPATSSNITLQPGPATGLAFFTSPPATATNGVTLTTSPVVHRVDQSGNAISGAGVAIAVQLGTVPGPATLNGTLSVNTAANGRATFSTLNIVGTVGDYTLRFTSGALPALESAPITLSAGAATVLTFTTAPPAAATSGVDLPGIVVQLRDGGGNAVSQAGVSIAAALGANPGGALSGTSPVPTGAGGSATFSNLRITGTIGDYTLAFTSGVLTAAVSNPITLAPGAATQLAITTPPPATATNGQNLGSATVVQLRDASGNDVAQAGVNVTAAIFSGPTGVLSGTVTVPTDGTGAASFGALQITGLVGSYVLRFSAGALTPANAPGIQLEAGPAFRLGVTTQPPVSVANATVIAPAIVVQVQDESGNAVADPGRNVTAALLTNAGGALSGTTQVATNASGAASFSNLTITGTTGSYTIGFLAGGLVSAETNGINLTPGTPTSLTFFTAVPGSATNNINLSPSPVVQLRDVSNNAVTQAGVQITATLVTNPGGVLNGTSQVNTAANGRATFNNLRITGLVGTYTIQFAGTGITPLASGNIAVQAGAATQVVFVDAPPPTATSGVDLSPNTVVRLGDVSGNLVATNGVTITASRTSGTATLSGTLGRATAAGVATFDDLRLTGTVGDHVLTFASAGLTSAVSNAIALAPGAVAALTFTTPPPTSGSSGVALSPAPQVQLRDASNNAVTTAGVQVTASIVSGGGTLTGETALAGAGGLATFSGLTITGTTGPRILAFTAPGVGTPLESAELALGAGGATKLSLLTAPSATARNGQPLAVQPVIQLLDADDNPVAEAGRTVTVAIGSGAGALSGTSLAVATDAAGQAVFEGLTITGTTGDRTLSFTSPDLASTASGTITLAAGTATALVITTEPDADAVVAVDFATAPVVKLVDQSGNDVDSVGVSITVTVEPVGPNLGGTLVRASVAGGTATFPGLSLTGLAGEYQLVFTGTSLTSATSAKITLAPGAAAQLVVEAQPTEGESGAALTPDVEVSVRDAGGNLLAGVTVTATIETDPSPGTITGTTAVATNGSGVAIFNNLVLTGAGNYVLRFTAGTVHVLSGTIAVAVP